MVPAVGQRNRQLIESLNQHIAQLDAELLALVKVEPESETRAPTEEHGEPTDELEDRWKASIALLLTIPGIGLLTGGFLVVVTLNFTLCESAEAAAQYVGLAPVLRSRGTSLRGRAQPLNTTFGTCLSVCWESTLEGDQEEKLVRTSQSSSGSSRSARGTDSGKWHAVCSRCPR